MLFRKHKRFASLLALILLSIALLLCFLFGSSYDKKKGEIKESFLTDEEAFAKVYPLLSPTPKDLDSNRPEILTVLTPTDQEALTITEGGNYLLSGNSKHPLIIDAPEESVHLFFDGLSISSKKGPALLCKNASKLLITLNEGSENILSDSGDYPSDGNFACLYSNCSLTINGKGKLTVNGYYKDAIHTKDVAKILNSTLTIKSKRTGISANDGLYMDACSINLSSEKNGLVTKKKGGDGKGNLVIKNSDLSIIAGRYCFVSEKADLLIFDTNLSLRSVLKDYYVGGKVFLEERGNP